MLPRRENDPQSTNEPQIRLSVEEGIPYLEKQIIEAAKNPPVTILISGGSSSGKSWLAEVMEMHLRDKGYEICIVPHDNFYWGKTYTNAEIARGVPLDKINYDVPAALELDALTTTIQQLQAGQAIDIPQYEMSRYDRTGKRPVLRPAPIILVEGLFVNTLPIEGNVIRVHVHASRFTRMIRRLLRDVDRTGQSFPAIFKQFLGTVDPMHDEYIEPQMQKADIVIRSNYIAKNEVVRAKIQQSQWKYALAPETAPSTQEALQKLVSMGKIRQLSDSRQYDWYFSPQDTPDFLETGETLRIREENKNFSLTYKGKPSRDNPQQRKVLTFPIDAEARQTFEAKFPRYLRIKKDRVVYQTPEGCVFTIDTVKTRKSDEAKSRVLGQFIELQSDWDKAEDFLPVLDALGLPQNGFFAQSYYELALQQQEPR